MLVMLQIVALLLAFALSLVTLNYEVRARKRQCLLADVQKPSTGLKLILHQRWFCCDVGVTFSLKTGPFISSLPAISEYTKLEKNSRSFRKKVRDIDGIEREERVRFHRLDQLCNHGSNTNAVMLHNTVATHLVQGSLTRYFDSGRTLRL